MWLYVTIAFGCASLDHVQITGSVTICLCNIDC